MPTQAGEDDAYPALRCAVCWARLFRAYGARFLEFLPQCRNRNRVPRLRRSCFAIQVSVAPKLRRLRLVIRSVPSRRA